MKTPLSLVVALCAVLLAACGPSVRTAQPTDVDLGKYETFAYLPNALVDVDGVENEELGSQIVEAVRMQMQQLGYNVDRSKPDLLVMLSTKRDTETETVSEPVYGRAAYPYNRTMTTASPYYGNYYYNGFAGYNGVVGYDTETYTYQTGTLILHLVDRKTKDVVWKAVSQDAVYDGRVSAGDIATMVDDMFAEFPKEEITALR